jgi:hypothetical protein
VYRPPISTHLTVTPQLFSGGTDPQCREPLWTSKYATDGAMYQHLATVNAARTKVCFVIHVHVRLNASVTWC